MSGTEPFDPFDPEEGANLHLRIVRSGGFPNYETSSFEPPSPIGDADMVASVLSHRHSLAAIVAPSQFKSYDELKRKFDRIVGEPKAA